MLVLILLVQEKHAKLIVMDVIIFYYRFVRDLCWRTKVQLILVHCDSTNNF